MVGCRAFSLYKTGSGFRYQIFSQLAEKIPNLPGTFPISRKIPILKVNFPNFAKNCPIFSPNHCIFSEDHTIFLQFHWYQKFPKKVRKSPGVDVGR